MKRRHLAFLLISGLLLAGAIPLTLALSNLSADVDSSSGHIPTMYVMQDVYKSGNETERPRPKYVPGEVIIRFKREATQEEIVGLRIGQEAEEVYVSPFILARRWRVPPSRTVEEWADFFDKHPLVEYAEPNYYVYASMAPNDFLYSYQWHLDSPTYGGIHMEAAWDIETGDPNIVVAVVDTGVAYEDYPAPSHWHIDTYNAYSGHSWWCGLNNPDWVTPPGYGDGWKEYLQHSFDLTNATGTVTFSYYCKSDIERGYDYFYVDVSDDGKASWTELKEYTNLRGPPGGRPVRWTHESVDLTSYKGKNILIRFRFNSDETYSDEDGVFNSDGAVYIDEVNLEDASGTLFYDDVESGAGAWETTEYEQAPDLAGTSFWINSDEIPKDEIDNDENGFVDDVNGWDFINSDAHPNDDNAHGTHVAGTVAQTTNNNLGVAGVAFKTTIMPVKVLNAAGTGTDLQVADGIYYAVNNGADIINLSLGASDPSATLEDAVAYAYDNGVAVFAASGNDNASSCDYPAAYDDYVIAVGATQYDETRAPYSNYGSSLDISAPGGNTGADQNNDGYADGVLQNTFGNTTVDWAYWFYQGTSMSTPHASGVAALLLARNPTLTPDQIRNVLESTAEDLGVPGRDDTYGWGLIDSEAALQSVWACDLVPLDGWEVDPRYTNEDYVLDSTESSLFLQLNATSVDSRVTIRHLGVPALILSEFAYVDVECGGTGSARVLLRFFLDDGSSFDVVYWKDSTTLNATIFDLAPYFGRTLRGDVYIGLMSSDGLTSNVTITEITFIASAQTPIPLSGWSADSRYTNADYVLNSNETTLSLKLNATDVSSRVTIRNLNVPKLNLTIYYHVDVDVEGSSNALVLLRFFLDDGSSFDVVYWKDPAALNATVFDLGPYSGRMLRGDVYIGLMSSDGLTSNIKITEIAFVAEVSPPSPLVPLSGWEVDPRYTNEDYVLDSTESSLFLELEAENTSSRVTIRRLDVQKLNLSEYDYVDVECSGTGNALVLLRFFLDDGSSFDVVYWKDPAALNATVFDLGPYSGRMLRGDVYIGLMSSDGLTSNVTITEITFVDV